MDVTSNPGHGRSCAGGVSLPFAHRGTTVELVKTIGTRVLDAIYELCIAFIDAVVFFGSQFAGHDVTTFLEKEPVLARARRLSSAYLEANFDATFKEASRIILSMNGKM